LLHGALPENGPEECPAGRRERPEPGGQAHPVRAGSQPWLEWADKQEQHDRGGFEVDPVVLHVHERVSAQAIVDTAARGDAIA